MKRILFTILYWTVPCLAGTKDGVWQVYRAACPPLIDGEMDPIWQTASYERLVLLNQDDTAPPDSYLDLFASSRLLWDADNFYVSVKVVEDEISSTSANSYENDSIEICFDGDNSKGDIWDGVNDSQTRWVWSTTTPSLTGDVVAWGERGDEQEGYSMELKLQAADLQFPLTDGQEIGLEIQVNDRDNEVHENIIRWWGGDNASWQEPKRMGTALLTTFDYYPFWCPPLPPYIAVEESESGVHRFTLSQNYPNPFNSSTTIRYDLPQRSSVLINVYDMKGTVVAVLDEGIKMSDPNSVQFDASQLSSGVYFYTLHTAFLQVADLLIEKTLILIKS